MKLLIEHFQHARLWAPAITGIVYFTLQASLQGSHGWYPHFRDEEPGLRH